MKSFAELAAVKTALTKQAAKAAAKLAQEKAAQEAAEREANLFKTNTKNVKPLPPTNRAELKPKKRPSPHPAQRLRDEAQVLQDALSDEFGVDQLLETDEALAYRAEGIGLDVLRKLRRGQFAVQYQLDLHNLRSDEARLAVTQAISFAQQQGWRCIRIVHGKGLGSIDKVPVLKNKVKSWLVQKTEVLAFTAARPAEGGAGAVIVLLKSA